MGKQGKATNAPSNISKSWCSPLTIRDRWLRFLGFNWAPPKPPSVKLTLEGLSSFVLPNNLMAAGLAPDLTPAYTDPVASALDVNVSLSAISPSVLSVPATAAPLDLTTGAPQWTSQIPDATVIAVARNSPAAALTPADMLFQSAMADSSANPYGNVFGDPLQGAAASQSNGPSTGVSSSPPGQNYEPSGPGMWSAAGLAAGSQEPGISNEASGPISASSTGQTTLTLTNPGNLDNATGDVVSLQSQAQGPAGAVLT